MTFVKDNEKNESYEKYSDLYKEISELIGEENTLILYNRFKGQQVSFPLHLYSSEYIKKCIIEEYNGSNIRELALKYCFTERWIRKILSGVDKNKNI